MAPESIIAEYGAELALVIIQRRPGADYFGKQALNKVLKKLDRYYSEYYIGKIKDLKKYSAQFGYQGIVMGIKGMETEADKPYNQAIDDAIERLK